MKKLVLLISVLISFKAWAGGGTVGNGGNGVVAEFYREASEAIWQITELFAKDEHAIVGPGYVAISDLIHLLDGVAVSESDKPLYLKGNKVSAINYPKLKKIIFNSNDWRTFDRRTKLNLIFHELIGLKLSSQLNDKNYIYSRSKTDKSYFSSAPPGRAGSLGTFSGLNPYVT